VIALENLLDEEVFDDMCTLRKVVVLMAMVGDGFNKVIFCQQAGVQLDQNT